MPLRRGRFTANHRGVTVQPRSRGRPKLGDYRLETIVSKEVWNELLAREKAGKGYRTRIAAEILTTELIGHINSPGDSPRRTSRHQ
jgi:hypothetical protein